MDVAPASCQLPRPQFTLSTMATMWSKGGAAPRRPPGTHGRLASHSGGTDVVVDNGQLHEIQAPSLQLAG